jgi:hypothetical protein
MAGVTVERWRLLLRNLREDVPLHDMALYVKPPRGCADDIASALVDDPPANKKYLLIGARGGGKSTELRRIASQVVQHFALAEIDLDASGIAATNVSAFDLLYISALCLLQHVPDAQRHPLFQELVRTYGGEDATKLGDVKNALEGIVTFAKAAASAAAAVTLPGAGPLAIAAAGEVVHSGLKLKETKGVVAESSPLGRSLQAICTKIARAAQTNRGRPLCVLVDGLEKMNGEATERFDQVFTQTRLIADGQWNAVIAAPPSTLVHVHSANSLGYWTKTVWGFPDDTDAVVTLLCRRFEAAELDPRVVDGEGLNEIARASGGLPRHAIRIAHLAVLAAVRSEADTLTSGTVAYAIREFGEQLALGLSEESMQMLARVHASGMLPNNRECADLFAHQRILARPPSDDNRRPTFIVHPLLVGDVERYAKTIAST